MMRTKMSLSRILFLRYPSGSNSDGWCKQSPTRPSRFDLFPNAFPCDVLLGLASCEEANLGDSKARRLTVDRTVANHLPASDWGHPEYLPSVRKALPVRMEGGLPGVFYTKRRWLAESFLRESCRLEIRLTPDPFASRGKCPIPSRFDPRQ
ncbi:uncharacterized protein THITE_2125697 [Thermothielavioides terrestris NRRL 8126]|uniref:Uncharacterized protein n=1 Tax=Thermothielavioides terrestris (strain ATCC 38088 / NRRL 8126) TaxID=578455 RepID=G2QXB7_THETT|nr:uncharacterized protein THITE_2125697 [Thermothielavioides terrestris NRRL 8126]AEO63140.1 hypothetical protein THITE_2125697 [Thermothielavioides terrestris NRRL 8126]